MKHLLNSILIGTLFLGCLADSIVHDKNNLRSLKKRSFSLLSVVQFPNVECPSVSSASMTGICLTESECTSAGGSSDGNCASGFGVCCIVTATCGDTISQNCSYIQNPGYPSTLSGTTTSCSITVNEAQNNVCQLRLDFNEFILNQPASATGECNVDSFAVTSPTGQRIPTLCGTLTDQHMYIDSGSMSPAATLAFTFTASNIQKFKIKVSQIECDNPRRAPATCLQYFTGTGGIVKSYNFGSMIKAQNYENCFRQEEGYCSINFSESKTTAPDPFLLTNAATNAKLGTTDCTVAYVIIPNGVAAADRFCGSVLAPVSAVTFPSTITSNVLPFRLGVFAKNAAQNAITGFNLLYTQVPCS